MSKSLYEEALADAKRLRELAEETAKNRLIETVMPQIRDMVNRRIMGEQLTDEDLEALSDDSDASADFDSDVLDDSGDIEIALEELPLPDMSAEIPVNPPALDPQSANNAGPVINVDAAGDVNIELESEETDDEEEDLVLNGPMAEALIRLLNGQKNGSAIAERLSRLENTFNKLKLVVEAVKGSKLNTRQQQRINKSFTVCLSEAHKLQKQLILNEQATQEDLEPKLTRLIKEMRNMSKSSSRNIFDFLFEAEDVKEEEESLEEAELSLELSDDEREDLAGAEDAEAVDVALEDIIGGLEVSLEAEAGEEEEEGVEGEIEPAAEEEELEIAEEGDVYEIDENMLRRELRRLTEQEAADADPSLAHGGEEVGDVFVDVDEEDLINALADELGDAPAPTVESRRRSRRRGRHSSAASKRLQEARRVVRKQSAAINQLKKQLVEMNLFNAKLLYANKLMQNKSLSLKNQRTIVEALDSAKTLSEAKLLYKSLSKSLERKKTRKGLNEGSLRRIGSSSRPVRSSQPAKTGNADTDRWAILAGL